MCSQNGAKHAMIKNSPLDCHSFYIPWDSSFAGALDCMLAGPWSSKVFRHRANLKCGRGSVSSGTCSSEPRTGCVMEKKLLQAHFQHHSHFILYWLQKELLMYEEHSPPLCGVRPIHPCVVGPMPLTPNGNLSWFLMVSVRCNQFWWGSLLTMKAPLLITAQAEDSIWACSDFWKQQF